MSALLSVPLDRRLHRLPVVPLLHGRLAERAWSWDWNDQWTREWWPQGITSAGERLLVSWYAKAGGSRVSVVDLAARSYAHVTLQTPAGEPLKVHAGGLAWVDGWLYVAATARGFWTLHESDLDPGTPTWRARAVHRPDAPDDGPPLRWSFLDAPSVVKERTGSPLVEARAASPGVEVRAERASKPTHLYAGEYGRGQNSTRLWRLPVHDGQPAGDPEPLGTGPRGMQGVTAAGDGLVVSTSNGPWTRGSLHELEQRPASIASDEPGSRPRDHDAPIGVEDLTTDPGGQLWTAAEHPGRRAIVGVSPSSTSWTCRDHRR